MKKFIFIVQNSFYLILLFTFLQSCSGAKTCDCNSLAGDYSFYISDSLGARLLEGNAIFKEVTRGNYSMDIRNLNELSDFPGVSGFRTKNPIVTYNSTTRKIFISLLSGESDYGVYIHLEQTGNTLSGEWSHTTMRGTINKGRFIANKTNF